jgi:hypothetical protein
MHRLPSRLTIFRFRCAAILLCAKCVLAPIAVGILLLSTLTGDPSHAQLGVGLALLTLLIALLQWLMAARTSCPLCMTPVLAKKHCMTHRHARPLFGSYRLRVACAILFRNTFHCPYCHEPTAMEVREKKYRG